MKRLSLLLLLAAPLVLSGAVLSPLPSPASPVAPLTSVAASSDAFGGAAVFTLPTTWNDPGGTSLSSVSLTNKSAAALRVIGVQASQGIFVTDFPSSVGAGQSQPISFVFQAPDNTDGGAEIIRVLTDQGVKSIVVQIDRGGTIQFDTKQLSWTVGGAATAKAVTITVAGNATMPKAARTVGGITATLGFLGAGRYTVTIQPASTAQAGTFPVFVDFDPALPGGPAVLTATVQKP